MTRLMRSTPWILAAAVFAACPSSKPPDTKDTIAPKVESISPADGASDVALNSKVTVTFSEDIAEGSLELAVSAGGNAVEGALELDGDTATFTPGADLPESAEVQISVTAYADAAGNAGEAAQATFTTVSGAPQVSSTNPADGAQNVAVTSTVTATFSEEMDASSIDGASFLLLDGSNPVAGEVTYNAGEQTAVFTPSTPLLESRTYTATLTTALRDSAGIHLAAAKTWTFTTAASVPTVVSISPQDGTIDVPGNAPVEVVFSEGIDPATLTAQNFVVAVQGGASIDGSYAWDAPSRTATFQPTGAYPGGATIVVTLTTGITDTSGIALGADASASFTISNAPSVSASSPAPNDVDVALSASVDLTFSQPINVATLTSANVWIEDDQQQKLAANYIPTATTLTIAPNAQFDESSVYTVVVSTAVTAATGVPFAAEYRFSFTTLGIPPTVTAVQPASFSSDVPVTAKVQLTFSEDMDTTTFTATSVRLSNGAADVAGTVTAIDARNVEFTPSAALLETSTYTIIATVDLKDLAGNALPSEFRSTFVTEPLPRIVSISPVPNATNVPNGSAVVFVANKGLDASTVTITPPTGTPQNTATLYEDGTVIEGAIAYDPSTRSIRIKRVQNGAVTPWSAGKRYVVTLDGSKLEDVNGNAVGGIISTTFVAGATADTTAPTVVTLSPQNGQVGVSRSEKPFVVFSEPIDPTTLSSVNIDVKDGATSLSGRIEYQQLASKVVFIPNQPLPANKTLTFTVGVGIADLSGNVKTGVNIVSFSTQPNTAPTLAAISPGDGATDVEVNRSIRLDFSEPISSATLAVTVSDGMTPIAGTVAYDDSTASAVFTPSANLPAGKTLDVKIAAGLADKEGEATTTEIARSFTTIANSANDVSKPAVSSTIPANNAMGISGKPVIQISFSEPLNPNSVGVSQFVLQEVGGNKVPFGMSYSVLSDTASLTPSIPLSPGKSYEVQILGGLTDLAGNALDAMAASSTFTFTVDGSAPSIVSRSPVPMSTVGSSVAVELVFSEDMNPATIDAASLTLSMSATPVLAAVWYDASGRTAFLRPAAKLADGTYTVNLDGMRAADLAGNGVTDSFSFTVSSAGPSVVAVSPCGTTVDHDDFGNTVVTLTFDPGVRKTGGGALDGSALQLRVNGAAVAATVSHTQGATVATLTPSAALLANTQYEVFVDKDQVQNATTAANMTSDYSCTFQTQQVIFEDDMDPMPVASWTNGATGGHQWKALNSVDDPSNSTQVWRGGNANDGQNYTRICGLSAASRTVVLERDVTLPNINNIKLRFDEFHSIAGDPNDVGRVQIVYGGNPITLDTFTGTTSAYAAKEYDVSAYKNATVKLRYLLFIDAGPTLGACPGGGKGVFIDNIRIVGE